MVIDIRSMFILFLTLNIIPLDECTDPQISVLSSECFNLIRGFLQISGLNKLKEILPYL